MRRDIQDALLSVAEVAIFAWSLLELLLTRILPLAGFLAGHLLLEFGSLLTSVVIPAAAGRRRKPRAEDSWDVQAEGLIEEENVQEDGDDHQKKAESLKSSSDKLEDAILRSLVTEDEKAATIADVQQPAPPVIDHHAAANEAPLRGSDDGHVEESSPSDDQVPRNVGQAQAARPVVGIEQGHVSSKGEGDAGKMGLEPSDGQTSEEATTSEEAKSPATDEGEMPQSSRSRRSRMRVLPPSLSQVKRTLMQRSRRASPSGPLTSSALLAPSPSPIKKKQQHRASRRNASSAIKASASYDFFMRNFRNHFLLDAA